MSDDEFVAYLKKKGLKEKDCSKLEGMFHDHFMLTVIPAYCLLIFADNGIGAQAFTEMTDTDIDDKELGFTFGGRKILKQVLQTLSK